jgi:hypothetical protein
MEARRKTLCVAPQMITSGNAVKVVLCLKKQVQATADSDNGTYDKSVEQETRKLLTHRAFVRAISGLARSPPTLFK